MSEKAAFQPSASSFATPAGGSFHENGGASFARSGPTRSTDARAFLASEDPPDVLRGGTTDRYVGRGRPGRGVDPRRARRLGPGREHEAVPFPSFAHE